MTPLARRATEIAAHVLAGSQFEIRDNRPVLVVPLRPGLLEAMFEVVKVMDGDPDFRLPFPWPARPG